MPFIPVSFDLIKKGLLNYNMSTRVAKFYTHSRLQMTDEIKFNAFRRLVQKGLEKDSMSTQATRRQNNRLYTFSDFLVKGLQTEEMSMRATAG